MDTSSYAGEKALIRAAQVLMVSQVWMTVAMVTTCLTPTLMDIRIHKEIKGLLTA